MKKKVAPAGYITWNEGESEKARLAMAGAEEALAKVRPLVRAHGSDIFLNVGPGSTSVRDGFDRDDYEAYRPGESEPRTPKEVMRHSDCAYEGNGIVANVIDMMADFAAKGIRLVHPNERVQKFHRAWFKLVNGPGVTERLANYLLRHGTTICKRSLAKIPKRDERDLRRTTADNSVGASPDISLPRPPEVSHRTIPGRYNFLNPQFVDIEAEDVAPFIGQDDFVYGLTLPLNLYKRLARPTTSTDKRMVARLPDDLLNAVRRGEKFLPLDSAKLNVVHFKRDDWKPWGKCVLRPLLKDIRMLEKAKLADLAALDGAISSIRVWKLGSLEHRIMPSAAVIMRLAEMLTSNVAGGVMDLVWGPDIELLETKTDAHNFLGSSKYAPILQAIYSGLGIPQTMTGSDTATGFTNNAISLKTLVERLVYLRSLIVAFWERELSLLQRAMQFRLPARVTFDNLLTDTNAEMQLLMNLADRGLIDFDTLVEEFGFDPDIVAARLRKDGRRRKNGQLPPKAGPFHSDANLEGELVRNFAGTGAYSPSEFGVELKPKKAGQKTPSEIDAANKPKPTPGALPGAAPKGQPGAGRPKLGKDASKRKQKTVKPRRAAAVFADYFAQARSMQERLAQLVTPAYLRSVGCKTLRELTDAQADEFERLKFDLLCQFKLGEEVGEASVSAFLENPLVVPVSVRELLDKTVSSHMTKQGRDLTLAELRVYHASVFALYRGEFAD